MRINKISYLIFSYLILSYLIGYVVFVLLILGEVAGLCSDIFNCGLFVHRAFQPTDSYGTFVLSSILLSMVS
jgi:hypothetical protein